MTTRQSIILVEYLQVTIAIKDRNLPVVCCSEGCDLPLAWRDFYQLSSGHFELPDLAASALSAHVLTNRDKVAFCPTPECPMAYRVTSEEREESAERWFLCPACGAGTCTACGEEAHEGKTCATLRTSQKAGEGLIAWVRGDPGNRKACPGCGIPIEKTGGCWRMCCTACGAVFCWLCDDKRFASKKDCDDHLVKEHGGIFPI